MGTGSGLTVHLIKKWIEQEFEGVEVKDAYSEFSFFYNPGRTLPNGVYFLTIKEKDGPNDQASRLDRDGVFRISFKPAASSYRRHFGDKPRRPLKGGRIDPKIDYSLLDIWLPHPIYAWMGWTMILNPSPASLDKLRPFIEESYLRAREMFLRRVEE